MFSFRPEPDPMTRRALILALERLQVGDAPQPAAYRSEWRRAALEEGVWDEGEEEPGR